MRWGILLVAAALLGACAAPPVHLKHKETGQVIKCGPYDTSVRGALREAQCISDYQRQGYERVPAP